MCLTRDPALPCSGGIQWAWDDSLCKDTAEAHGFSFLANHSSFEEQFHEARCMRSPPPPHLPAACTYAARLEQPSLCAVLVLTGCIPSHPLTPTPSPPPPPLVGSLHQLHQLQTHQGLAPPRLPGVGVACPAPTPQSGPTLTLIPRLYPHTAPKPIVPGGGRSTHTHYLPTQVWQYYGSTYSLCIGVGGSQPAHSLR